MAFTKSLVTQTVLGNRRVLVYNVTPDSTAGSITTEDTIPIKWAEVSIKSMASFVNSGSTRNIAVFAENKGATGTTIAGTLAMTGTIANDVYRVVVYK